VIDRVYYCVFIHVSLVFEVMQVQGIEAGYPFNVSWQCFLQLKSTCMMNDRFDVLAFCVTCIKLDVFIGNIVGIL